MTGKLAEETDLAEKLRRTGNAVFVPFTGEKDQDHAGFMAAFESLYARISPVECRAEKVGIQRYDQDGKVWVHILNYRYSEKEDRVLPIEELILTLRNVPVSDPEILVPEGSPVPDFEQVSEGDSLRLVLRHAGLYTVLAFS